jgi:hypothetical protein
MARTKGSKNKLATESPATVRLTTDEKINFLANIIVERISDDLKNGKKLLRKVRRDDAARTVKAP